MTLDSQGRLGWREIKRRSLFFRLGLEVLRFGVTKHKKKKKLKIKIRRLYSICLLAGCLIIFLSIQRSSRASADSGIPEFEVVEERDQLITATSTGVHLPVARDVIIKTNQTIYAYSSTIQQTDNSPYTTASGRGVKKGTIANNCLPFGTKVFLSIPWGSRQDQAREYEVQDRMNERYGCNDWDIWHLTRQEALQWGSPTMLVKILL